MVTVTIDVSDAKVLLEEARREGGGRLRTLWEWSRGFAERGLEALLGMELTVLLERERAAGITNWRNGYRSRTLSLAGLGRLGFLVRAIGWGITAASFCRFASGARRSWKSLRQRCF